MPLNELFTPLAALAVVVLLACGMGRAVRWKRLTTLAGPARSRPLAIRAALAIDPKRRLLLVSCEDRKAVLLTGPHGDTFLGWFDGPASGLSGDGTT